MDTETHPNLSLWWLFSAVVIFSLLYSFFRLGVSEHGAGRGAAESNRYVAIPAGTVCVSGAACTQTLISIEG